MRALVCLLSLPLATRRSKYMMAVFAAVVTALTAPSAIAQAVSGQVALVPVINTVAGDGTPCHSGDGLLECLFKFNTVQGVVGAIEHE